MNLDYEAVSEEKWQDKSEWGDGPWQEEPDRVEWRIGPFVGLALRHAIGGNWCGYLGVPPGHPWHGEEPDADVHGGLTFVSPCIEDDRPQRERLCHVPRPGETDDVWWLGFDCHHFMDVAPGYESRMRELARSHSELGFLEEPSWLRSEYRTIDYVKGEVQHLAEQAAACCPRCGLPLASGKCTNGQCDFFDRYPK